MVNIYRLGSKVISSEKDVKRHVVPRGMAVAAEPFPPYISRAGSAGKLAKVIWGWDVIIANNWKLATVLEGSLSIKGVLLFFYFLRSFRESNYSSSHITLYSLCIHKKETKTLRPNRKKKSTCEVN